MSCSRDRSPPRRRAPGRPAAIQRLRPVLAARRCRRPRRRPSRSGSPAPTAPRPRAPARRGRRAPAPGGAGAPTGRCMRDRVRRRNHGLRAPSRRRRGRAWSRHRGARSDRCLRRRRTRGRTDCPPPGRRAHRRRLRARSSARSARSAPRGRRRRLHGSATQCWRWSSRPWFTLATDAHNFVAPGGTVDASNR